jgi:hypothetical protein
MASLCGALALLAIPPLAAQPVKSKTALPTIADFERMSGSRARDCGAVPPEARVAAMGEPGLRHCAWSQRVEMLYWPEVPHAAGACLPPPAIAWHRLASLIQPDPEPWNTAWTGRALAGGADALQQAVAVWPGTDGAWSAVLWRWQPSPKADTRNWQQARWNRVLGAARALGLGSPAAQASPLLDAWLASAKGKPRVVDKDSWRWVSDNTCISMQTAGISQAQLHLPYSRDDARLEQRSAMQVQLARRFPTAEWLLPFTLLDPALPGTRTGAKFIAVWKEGAAVKGQLWIPLRDGGGIVRARVSTALASKDTGPAQEQARQRAQLLARELTALAHAWEARHE